MKKIVLISLFVAFLFACKRGKNEYFYYDTGELRTVKVHVGKDSAYYMYRSYYKNQQLQQEGHTLRNGYLQGFWKEYYSDGQLKWQGYYENSTRVYEKLDYNTLDAEIVPLKKEWGITLDEPFLFRIYVDKVHPGDYTVTKFYSENITVSDIRNDDYPYTLTLTSKEVQMCDKKNPIFKCDTFWVVAHVHPYPFRKDTTYQYSDYPEIIFQIPIKKE